MRQRGLAIAGAGGVLANVCPLWCPHKMVRTQIIPSRQAKAGEKRRKLPNFSKFASPQKGFTTSDYDLDELD